MEHNISEASEHYTLAADEGEAIWFTGTLGTIKASGTGSFDGADAQVLHQMPSVGHRPYGLVRIGHDELAGGKGIDRALPGRAGVGPRGAAPPEANEYQRQHRSRSPW